MLLQVRDDILGTGVPRVKAYTLGPAVNSLVIRKQVVDD